MKFKPVYNQQPNQMVIGLPPIDESKYEGIYRGKHINYFKLKSSFLGNHDTEEELWRDYLCSTTRMPGLANTKYKGNFLGGGIDGYRYFRQVALNAYLNKFHRQDDKFNASEKIAQSFHGVYVGTFDEVSSNNLDAAFVYIGKCIDQTFIERWWKHYSLLKNNNHHCKRFQSAYNRRGVFPKFYIVRWVHIPPSSFQSNDIVIEKAREVMAETEKQLIQLTFEFNYNTY